MLYYKIPITDNCFDYPAGCLLCCGYHLDGYYYCKFETCPEVGTDWVEITAEEFDANCPDFSAGLPSACPPLPSPASAEVGQKVRISAVDENGVATATEAVDDPVNVAEDGYTNIAGLRHLVSGKMIRNGQIISIHTVWDGDVTHEEVITLDENGLPVNIESDGQEIPIEMEGFDPTEVTLEEVAAAAEEAKTAVDEGKRNGFISREFNIKSDSETGSEQLSHSGNKAWFYIIEIMDPKNTTKRETISVDYFSLISGNTFTFPCGASIVGSVSEDKTVTVFMTSVGADDYKLSRFTGYL